MNKEIAYIIFVSYNRNEYELKENDLDDMSIEDFIDFNNDDEIDCKSITITPIYDFTNIICGGSEKFDDSVYWFVTKQFADKFEKISKFIQEYK